MDHKVATPLSLMGDNGSTFLIGFVMLMANCKLLYLFAPKNAPPVQVLACCTDWENPLDSSQTREGDIGNENMSAAFNYIRTSHR